MHEYSLVLSMIERVEQEVRSRGASAAQSVRVSVGELSGVEAELFSSAFEIAREGTLLCKAALQVVAVPARWQCSNCNGPIDSAQSLVCNLCGSQARLVEGGDIVLERIEMEVP